MSDNNNMEEASLMNTENSCKTPQFFWEAISRICEKLPKSSQKKQVVIKSLAEKSVIIHSEKQPSHNVTSKIAQFVKNFFTHPDIFYKMLDMKD